MSLTLFCPPQFYIKYYVKESNVLVGLANQAVQTLDKYKTVLDKALNSLSVLEYDGMVSINDVPYFVLHQKATEECGLTNDIPVLPKLYLDFCRFHNPFPGKCLPVWKKS